MHALPLSERLCLDDFLSINPTGNALVPGEPREKFFECLGMDERNPRNQALYAKMKSEAKAGMRRLFASRQCLDPSVCHDDRVVPPYSLEQISELAFQREVNQIYETASLSTRGVYDLIQTDSSNWIIRWMLWRVIYARYERRSSDTLSNSPPAVVTTSPTVTEVSCATIQTPCTSIWSTTVRASSVDTVDGCGGWDKQHGAVHVSFHHRHHQHHHIPPDTDPNSGRKRYWDHVLGG